MVQKWDEPLALAPWDVPPDPDRIERWRLQARDVPRLGITVGRNIYSSSPICITPKDLATHMQVIGSTNVGKSYFLEGIIKTLIMQGHGVCVIDPHGDL